MGNSKVGFTDQAFAQIFEGKYLMEVYSIFQEEHDFFYNYYFDVRTMRLVQFIIQTNKCATYIYIYIY